MNYNLIGWIWLLTFPAFGYAVIVGANLEKIKMTDCWNYGKHKSLIAAPVFSFDDENLSTKDCGKWDRNNEDDIAPWLVFLHSGSSFGCPGLILSERTVITPKCTTEYSAFVKRDEIIQMFSGECVQNGDNCFGRRGLQSKKVLDAKIVKIELGSYFVEEFFVWKVEKLSFNPSLKPVCLWGHDNQNNAQDIWYHFNMEGKLIMADILPEGRCYGNTMQSWECELYGNAICTIVSSAASAFHRRRGAAIGTFFTLINRGGRFYLRGILNLRRIESAARWLDVLPFTWKIVSASTNLAVFPQIPDLKKRIDFGQKQSYENCGHQPPRRIRRKREEDDEDEKERISFVAGGQNADSGQFPWHASLSFFSDLYEILNFCGATLISQRTLVTGKGTFTAS
ncbi:uncharacterized protein LOC132204000 isoform X2 [Neocloeon triangulifer]|uniref:uncharacterized protein LOC132204000 isoform X2 n=1 Tax=Neocloeon triangulifer TaxID=2078957 RepID=UPI00286EB99B|nr:uncharacterized protein LOC132204000 isoform X2 [Neocloeon triangulifer]